MVFLCLADELHPHRVVVCCPVTEQPRVFREKIWERKSRTWSGPSSNQIAKPRMRRREEGRGDPVWVSQSSRHLWRSLCGVWSLRVLLPSLLHPPQQDPNVSALHVLQRDALLLLHHTNRLTYFRWLCSYLCWVEAAALLTIYYLGSYFRCVPHDYFPPLQFGSCSAAGRIVSHRGDLPAVRLRVSV